MGRGNSSILDDGAECSVLQEISGGICNRWPALPGELANDEKTKGQPRLQANQAPLPLDTDPEATWDFVQYHRICDSNNSVYARTLGSDNATVEIARAVATV
ncbi:hypothetical protein MCOR27_002873 [Pyricularia oryzae]|uniref:Peptidase A2 domain-containing protein n=1 Tax=Pyricularia grisea TaxID=148305 RepID=A0ABQ8N318_PYRGI|nr:hypothetical protein MCOR01_007850 [Pyricularia oryzae]KAI6290436.1 hypothetical protein MCOR33_011312 [Pyricularia grisea]KAH9433494.1 hypothetical protein MCOR02_005542 [Pyricularia oryzae]KAI6253784.1 hypothetical protein MCOR19_009687 [Pyricularia oryzae]KAI6269097.1 hypothetical protein MCOR34_011725 [Pyricularia oryzae]